MKFFVYGVVLMICLVFISKAQAERPAGMTETGQIPICMVGDSITWYGYGDYWREYTLQQVPNAAFVGTHSAVLGYSHAGEGGNTTNGVLGRMDEIPDSPYYSLLIGTNDNNAAKSSGDIESQANTTANNIVSIINGLLAKPGTEKVFLSSLLPCDYPSNPYRTQTNARTNEILQGMMGIQIPNDKVTYVDYETPILATQDWESKIELHPNTDGYQIIANTFSQALTNEFGAENINTPSFPEGSGVMVENLWDSTAGDRTTQAIIAGWYTVSFLVEDMADAEGAVVIRSNDGKCLETVIVNPEDEGTRIFANIFTGYEGYGYNRTIFRVESGDCTLGDILFEKSRPEMVPSIYMDEQFYLDNVTAPSLGELVVVPEPATLGILATFGLALLKRKKAEKTS